MSNSIRVTQAQLDDAVNVVADAIKVGEDGTRGDYTEIGLLSYVFGALDLDVGLIEDDQ